MRIGRVIEPPGSLDPKARQVAIRSLEGELGDLIDDAAARGVGERGAEDLLLTTAILRWLRKGGDLPATGSIELMEIHAAIFNGARHEEELELQRAFVEVLVALVEAHAEAIAAGRWRERRVDDEAARKCRLRRLGAHVDELRRSRDLTIGELAAKAELDVVTVVEVIHGAEEPGALEIRRLAKATGVEPGALFPEGHAGGASDDDARPDGGGSDA
jgi:hypothetical protein